MNDFTRIEINRSIWEVPQRYQNLESIGSGTFGQVCSAYDTCNGNQVAIKKLARPFQSEVHAKRTFRELSLLKHMNHENVIGLLHVFTPSNTLQEFRDVYLVSHLMDADLYHIIRTLRLEADQVQFIVYQILRGLKYIHSAEVIHRDLKPNNIAVNNTCELRILDFGLARQTESEMTGYVAARWYRAPEIMLNWMHYNLTADIWSVGCIMAELITYRPLFPAKNHIEHLNNIIDLCGTPDEDFMIKVTHEDARTYIRSLPQKNKKNFKHVFVDATDEALDLLQQMLELDPDKRPTAEMALAHPYLTNYSDHSDEPIAERYDESFEGKDLTVDEWKELVYKEIVNFVPKIIA